MMIGVLFFLMTTLSIWQEVKETATFFQFTDKEKSEIKEIVRYAITRFNEAESSEPTTLPVPTQQFALLGTMIDYLVL